MARTSTSYEHYDQVPFYRKRGFLYLTLILFSPLAIFLLLSGEIFYQNEGKVIPFGLKNRLFIVVVASFFLVRLFWAYSHQISEFGEMLMKYFS